MKLRSVIISKQAAFHAEMEARELVSHPQAVEVIQRLLGETHGRGRARRSERKLFRSLLARIEADRTPKGGA